MALLDLVLPRRCLVCGEPGLELCAPCRRWLPRLPLPLCERCGAPTGWPVQRCAECNGRRLAFTSARAAVVYDAPVRALVGAWKERGQRSVAAIAAELIEETIRRPDVNAVVPVAADGGRRARRGHSPAARLANEIGARWDLPVRDVLVRAEGRRPQRGLALVERRRNVSGAFVAVTAVPARVVVVDDVYTSGATVAAAASALRKGGAEHVQVVTFARAVR